MFRRVTTLFVVVVLAGVQSVSALASPPPNDHFADRIKILSLPHKSVVDASQATHDATDPAPTCAPVAVNTVWYEYVATFTGKLRIDTYGSPFDTVLAAFTDQAPIGLSEVACSDDDGSAKQSRLEFDVAIGTTYYFEVGGWAISSGSLTLNVVAPYMPHNDHFANAVEIFDLPFESNPDDTSDATLEPSEPSPCHGMTRTMWFKYLPSFRRSISLEAAGQGFGAAFGIYSGETLDGLVNVVCSNSNGTKSVTVFPGTTYYFQVGSKSGNAGGDLTLKVSSPPRPANDDLTQAMEIPGIPSSFSGTTVGATLEPEEPTPSCGAGLDHTVWYRMTAESTAQLRAAVSTFSIIGIYKGDSLENLEPVECDDGWGNATRVNFQAQAGVTYYFQIGGWGQSEVSFTFSLLSGPMPANDDFANAIEIMNDLATITGNNEAATWEKGEPVPPESCTFPPVRRSIWYKYTPVVDGTVRVDAAGSKFYSVLAAYTGSKLNDLQQVSCNDWQGYGSWNDSTYTGFPDFNDSRIDFQVTAGTTYYFQLSGEWGYAGKSVLNFYFHPYTRTEAKTYVLGLPYYNCPDGGSTCIGGNRFSFQPGDASLTVTLEDVTGLPVAGFLYLYNQAGSLLGWKRICGSGVILPLPEGGRISVWVNSYGDDAVWCPGSLTKWSEGITGTIKVDFK